MDGVERRGKRVPPRRAHLQGGGPCVCAATHLETDPLDLPFVRCIAV